MNCSCFQSYSLVVSDLLVFLQFLEEVFHIVKSCFIDIFHFFDASKAFDRINCKLFTSLDNRKFSACQCY